MKKPDLRTPEKAKKDIKIINQRIRRVYKEYGDSPYYQQYVRDIKRNFKSHVTKDGVLQIDNPKNANYNKYQNQVLNKLSANPTVSTIKAKAKKRLQEAGINKPTKQQIQSDVIKYIYRQQHIDDTLDLIYDETDSGMLPSDIQDMYNNFRNHDTSNTEIDEMIDKAIEWQSLKDEFISIEQDIKNDLDYVDEWVEHEVFEVNNGQQSVDQIKHTIETLKKYYEQRTAESEI